MGRILVQVLLLPVRTFLYGMGMMAETFKGMQQLAQESLDEVTDTVEASLGPPRLSAASREATEKPLAWDSEPQEPRALNPQIVESPVIAESVRADIEQETNKEDRKMYMDQDLSGDMVKVVQYSIVSVVPGIADNTRIIAGPCLVAFSDDMTPEDFTAWIVAEMCPDHDPRHRHHDHDEHHDHDKHHHHAPGNCPPAGGPFVDPCHPSGEITKCWDKKYMRVAFTVMGRFSVADINWEQLQAMSVAKLANKLDHFIDSKEGKALLHSAEGQGESPRKERKGQSPKA